MKIKSYIKVLANFLILKFNFRFTLKVDFIALGLPLTRNVLCELFVYWQWCEYKCTHTKYSLNF